VSHFTFNNSQQAVINISQKETRRAIENTSSFYILSFRQYYTSHRIKRGQLLLSASDYR